MPSHVKGVSTFTAVSCIVYNNMLIYLQKPAAECFFEEITCDNGKCVLELYFCDGHNDCGDNTDEVGCHGMYNLHVQCTVYTDDVPMFTWLTG